MATVAPAWAQEAQEPQPSRLQALAGLAKDQLKDSSIVLGAGWVQGIVKLTQKGSAAQITDNGKPNLLLDYYGREKALAFTPMLSGDFLLGWNLTATAGQFQVDRQLENSGLTGTPVGTSITGEYLAVAPRLFVRLGPLSPHQSIYWSFGAGVGAGAIRDHGTARFGSGTNPVETLPDPDRVRPAAYGTLFWQLDVGHWVLVFNGKLLLIKDPNYSFADFESYGLNLGYRITF
jgi:hypothetical protein